MDKIKQTIIFCIFYIIGIVAYQMNFVMSFALLLLLFLLFLIWRKILSNNSAIIIYLSFLLSLVNCHIQIKNFDDLSQHLPFKGTIVGEVVSIPTSNNELRTKFYVKIHNAKFNDKTLSNLNARTMVTIYDKEQNFSKIKIADKIELTGEAKAPIIAKNPSQFDYAQYLKNHKTFSTFTVKAGIEEQGFAHSWKILAAPDTFNKKFVQKLNDKRTDILHIHKKYIQSPNIEVLGGIVFGDDAINPPDYIKNSFINSGLLHILAASGMNVSIIFGIWFFIGTRLRLNYRAVIFIGSLLVVFYTLMTGLGASVLRAALMIEFVLLGKLINRNADSIALVFVVAFLMLLYNPLMINDIGFQLSFVVTFALMFMCPPILEKIENKVVSFCAGIILVPIVAQLFAAPIQMFYFNTFATYSIIANFLIVPFVMIVSFLGFFSSIIAMLPFGVLVDKVCCFADFILNPVVSCLIAISDYFSQLPNSLLDTAQPNIIRLILYYTILILFGVFLCQKYKNKKFVILLAILISIFALSFVNFEKFKTPKCEIIIFDVGNADSFLIKTPDKKYVMIDTAHGRFANDKSMFSQADAIMGKYLRNNGIKHLDLLVLTHFDADHSGGAIDIMKVVDVDRVLISKHSEDNSLNKLIRNYLNENKVNYDYAKHNDCVLKDEKNNFELTTYVPNFSINNTQNETSTIILLSFGEFDTLFMADGSYNSFENIKPDLKKEKIEVLKSGHHGARDTVSTSMLNDLKPDVTVISTGPNKYGHPAKETLNTLSASGTRILRTDTNNAIKIVADNNGYKLYVYDNQSKKFLIDK